MRRGDVVVVAAPGDYGKPRPAVVVQSDRLPATDSVLVALVTSVLVDAPLYRSPLEASETNGLKVASQIMVDKLIAMPRTKCGKSIGRLDDDALVALNHLLSLVIGLAD